MNSITKVIKRHGFTLVEVAKRMGVHVQSVKSAVGGNPSVKTLERIAEVVGCDVSEFFETSKNSIACPHCGGGITLELSQERRSGIDIKGVIRRHGLTQKEVAERMSVDGYSLTYQSLKGILSTGNPTLKTLERMASAIGCSVSDFFCDSTTCPHCGKVITIKALPNC